MTRTVVAERVFSQFKNTEVWKVAVQVPSGKKYAFKDIIEPLKAMRYMMFLRKSQHADINEENFNAVRDAHNATKKAGNAKAGEPKKNARRRKSGQSKKEAE